MVEVYESPEVEFMDMNEDDVIVASGGTPVDPCNAYGDICTGINA